jgi:hypothetical protein
MVLFSSLNFTDRLKEITQDIHSVIKITQSRENYREFLLFLRRLPW